MGSLDSGVREARVARSIRLAQWELCVAEACNSAPLECGITRQRRREAKSNRVNVISNWLELTSCPFPCFSADGFRWERINWTCGSMMRFCTVPA